MTESIKNELESMAIILHSGNAKTLICEALKDVKAGKVTEFDQKAEEAKKEIKLAHKAHAELLRKLSSEDNLDQVDLLLVHAEGHLSSTDVAVLVIEELGEIYKKGYENG
ncbi:PTS lactose/cellobiose transporter subunit IIA [Vagococcus fluvialis]|jgi:PTS system cellobiose-specific IIA component|uniref:PTS lactose/cellobiose transporter subunit IIA n=1 Tax=Vagococcus fluvialis TaxID=2738 RepID=UPI0014333086|nr:PTS lactose/cellobiose transporter subunit IIA [Vagococcus fluvialis]MBO0430121.1 PTS lactose/cellobiose transporter subunit IIA [Vagococcus fluvialis]MBO0488208.1 PTS lactose/cellobiose transporter subunit IIA [Vagococcus fluvialis]MDT2782661.1 PTS lactose/cellobiose transporter subunit IIA [Vagococcus fluvialis]NKC58381.1 PTS lactose/cellobiose transporter subunit IIA [Vagococcus fluvialis]NKD49387.1 PTS lactose/cellobiose transporter subunit IIA [Vagococcus fluvialis]